MNALKKVPLRIMTIPEFLTWADQQPGRWQLRDGLPELMAPASDNHGAIQQELGRLIGNHLLEVGSRCRVVGAPGVVPRLRSDRNMLVPDLGVTCSPPFGGASIPKPLILIEILSRSNEARTRANVWAYSTIPSVMEILLITSWKIEAEVLRRLPDGSWPELPEAIEMNGPLRIASIDFDTPLRGIYRTTNLVD